MKIFTFCLRRLSILTAPGVMAQMEQGFSTRRSRYEFIEVPKAASMNSMAAETYLCAAGSALQLLAVPGAILGAIIGAKRIISNGR